MTNSTHAGGFVVRKTQEGSYEVLLIRRFPNQPNYFLPGGSIEKEESDLHAAKRELIEETGLGEIVLIADLGQVVRGGVGSSNQRYQKTIIYFLFLSKGGGESSWTRKAPTGETFYCEWVHLADFAEKIQFSEEKTLAAIAKKFLK